MYLIELNDDDLENIISDSEYFTASDDEYFTADESVAGSVGYFTSSAYTAPSSSRQSSLSGSVKHYRKQVSQSGSLSESKKWIIDETEPKSKYRLNKHIHIEPQHMRNYYMWRRLIRAGTHPREAAKLMGSKFCYKQVKQKKSIQLFSIRLSEDNRVFFRIQEKERIVKILNIGGHSFG
ncbi:hypothetical protein SAMN05192562_1011315 [Kosakonia arachidis]|uniref:Uncharacterized protein n=1 Tax=Kosakonia arachidis TaxID=551989 RepID=A0A1I6ZR28_9ENTR|nr:hypothetical protein [Kosakonia arachidis]SFT65173.1 hypothetical protein SAMN05192562_1011315 [Kosakonia arachidis]